MKRAVGIIYRFLIYTKRNGRWSLCKVSSGDRYRSCPVFRERISVLALCVRTLGFLSPLSITGVRQLTYTEWLRVAARFSHTQEQCGGGELDIVLWDSNSLRMIANSCSFRRYYVDIRYLADVFIQSDLKVMQNPIQRKLSSSGLRVLLKADSLSVLAQSLSHMLPLHHRAIILQREMSLLVIILLIIIHSDE